MNIRVSLILLPLLGFMWFPSWADELIVVSATDNVEQLDPEDVAKIFLGKVTNFPSGDEVVPLDLDPSDPAFAEFARVVLKKSPSQLRAYWAKRVFTGKGKPPRAITTADELRILVSSHKRYLSYLKKNDADNSVRWVIQLKPEQLR